MADGIALRFDSVAYSAANERLLASVLAMPSTSLLSRPGRRPGGGLEVTVGGTPETATVAPGGGIITDTGGGGSFPFVIPSSVGIALAARPAGGTSRFDEVIAVIKNVDVRPADGTREVDIQLLTGTAGSSPTAPTIPTGALRLAELTVPASGSVSVAKQPNRIAALGGILPVSSATVRDAIEDIYDGLVVYLEDLDVLQVRANGAWVTLIAAAATGDDAWVDATLGSGFTHSTARTQYLRHAGMVTLAIASPKATITAGDTVCTVPAGFRPGRTLYFGGMVASSPINLQITTAGVVTCNNSVSGGVNATITYLAQN
jgi:hypothetical protein